MFSVPEQTNLFFGFLWNNFCMGNTKRVTNTFAFFLLFMTKLKYQQMQTYGLNGMRILKIKNRCLGSDPLNLHIPGKILSLCLHIIHYIQSRTQLAKSVREEHSFITLIVLRYFQQRNVPFLWDAVIIKTIFLSTRFRNHSAKVGPSILYVHHVCKSFKDSHAFKEDLWDPAHVILGHLVVQLCF